MRKGICNSLLVVAVTVCALTAAAAGQDVWDPAEHFAPVWESVAMERRIENPARNPEADPEGQRKMTVQGVVEMSDYEAVLGIDTRPKAILVQGLSGTEIYRSEDHLIGRSYRSTELVRRLAGPGESVDEFRFSIDIPLYPDQGYPRSFGRVEWSMNALIGETLTTVDIPFEAGEEWVEVVPGLEVLVAEASATEGSYIYKIEAIYDPNLVSYGTTRHWHFWSDEELPATLMVDMEMLNAAGEPVRGPNTSGGSGGGTSAHSIEGGLIEATSNGYGRCNACGDVATIRYTFALGAYELELPLVLEDIPFPGF
ncbi:MAG: hypothetical protein JSW27_16755 [Phycisphaerales bacterium]|nr:MAG: hypothetical protein JSW27_16755 [Phycisphaerales bacterium]